MKYLKVWHFAFLYFCGLLMGVFFANDPFVIQRSVIALIGTCIVMNAFDLARTRCTTAASLFLCLLLIASFAFVAFVAVTLPEIM